MIKSGYNHEFALETFKDDDIKKVEKFINQNKHFLKKTVYENIPEFEFLPGHRAVLLDIPNKIKQYNKSKEEKAEEKKKQAEEEIAVKTAELKKSLVKKVKNYTDKIEFETKVDETNIIESTQVGTLLQCRLKCSDCEKTFLCSFRKYWCISNFEKHLKEHKLVSQHSSQHLSADSNAGANVRGNVHNIDSVVTDGHIAIPNSNSNPLPSDIHRISSEQSTVLHKILHK